MTELLTFFLLLLWVIRDFRKCPRELEEAADQRELIRIRKEIAREKEPPPPPRPSPARLELELTRELEDRQRRIFDRLDAGFYGPPESAMARELVDRELHQLHRLLEVRVQEELSRARPMFVVHDAEAVPARTKGSLFPLGRL